jgi:DNA ligase 1
MLYKEIVELFENISSTSKRLQKTFYISELIKKTGIEDLEKATLMIQGKLFPEWDDRKIGIASKLVIKAINKATGISEEKIEEEWKKEGDLGNVAEILVKKKKQSSLFPRQLTLKEVFDNLRSLAELEGKGSVDTKLTLISDMLIHASPKEAKYLIRTLADNMRVGVGKGTVRDAVVWAYFSEELGIKYDPSMNDIQLTAEKQEEYNEITEKIQSAYDLISDIGKVAQIIKQKGISGLDELSLEPGNPINVMLFQKAKDIEDAFSIVGRPAAFEYKYDGFRMQIHKIKDKIRIFTRRLEDVTEQFPEVIGFIKENVKSDNLILDAEAVGLDPITKKYVAFQSISQRIKRKYDIEEVSKKFPIELNVFDIIFYEGETLINTPFKKRRDILKKIVKEEKSKIVLAKQIVTSDNKEAEKFYKESLSLGEEGVMAKNLEGIYKPGARVGYGVKIKPIMEPLDLVIIGAEYGEGKRSGWLATFYIACSEDGEMREIGKVSTGLKELEEEGVSFKEITELLKPLITKSSGKYVEVRPEIVIEVGYEEIQKSPGYSSGYALRFPRFLRLRKDDKTVDDINTLQDVERLYEQQRGRNK